MAKLLGMLHTNQLEYMLDIMSYILLDSHVLRIHNIF